MPRIASTTSTLFDEFEKNLNRGHVQWSIERQTNDGRPYYRINGHTYRIHLRQASVDRGSVTDPHERIRFQIPAAWWPFDQGVRNVVMGYVAGSNVYLARYINAFGQQVHRVNRSTYEDKERRAIGVAEQKGIETYSMRSGEVLVALRGDFLGAYLLFQEQWHQMGLQDILLGRNHPVRKDNGEIRVDLKEPGRRQTAFRRQTMAAYGNACAICNVQGATVQAAHVFAVAHGGNNTVNNGIALCANHHILYDDGLLAIMPDYSLRINYRRLETYKRNGLAFGLIDCLNATRKLRLPADKKDWPDPHFFLKTLEYHGWHIQQYMLEMLPRNQNDGP